MAKLKVEVKRFLCSFLCFCLNIDLLFAEDFDYDYVTCGSVLKLYNTQHHVRLHSHDVKYGSGSGQQSVTGVTPADDHNSYWQVLGKTGTSCNRGEPVKCGQMLRLMHVSTRRNLHSHHFQSPLSRHMEVSAFGEEGIGDEGDNWTIVCNDEYWDRNDRVRIKHVVTESFLHITGETYGRPISGQREICGYPSAHEYNYWKASEGIYIKPNSETGGNNGFSSSYKHDHDEF